MHNTVLHSGPVDEATPQEIDQIVTEVREGAVDIAPYEMTFSRPDIGNVAIESKGYPGAPHRRLWEMTGKAHQAVVGDRWPLIPAVSYPHLSHAYSGEEAHLADRSALKVALSDLHGDPVTVLVENITLVAEWHDRREITWDVLATVPLGGA